MTAVQSPGTPRWHRAQTQLGAGSSTTRCLSNWCERQGIERFSTSAALQTCTTFCRRKQIPSEKDGPFGLFPLSAGVLHDACGSVSDVARPRRRADLIGYDE